MVATIKKPSTPAQKTILSRNFRTSISWGHPQYLCQYLKRKHALKRERGSNKTRGNGRGLSPACGPECSGFVNARASGF